MQTGGRISFEYLKAFRLPLTTTHCVFIFFFATFKITPQMIKMLYLQILQTESSENWIAFCKLIVLDDYNISKSQFRDISKILPVALGILFGVYPSKFNLHI